MPSRTPVAQQLSACVGGRERQALIRQGEEWKDFYCSKCLPQAPNAWIKGEHLLPSVLCEGELLAALTPEETSQMVEPGGSERSGERGGSEHLPAEVCQQIRSQRAHLRGPSLAFGMHYVCRGYKTVNLG